MKVRAFTQMAMNACEDKACRREREREGPEGREEGQIQP